MISQENFDVLKKRVSDLEETIAEEIKIFHNLSRTLEVHSGMLARYQPSLSTFPPWPQSSKTSTRKAIENSNVRGCPEGSACVGQVEAAQELRGCRSSLYISKTRDSALALDQPLIDYIIGPPADFCGLTEEGLHLRIGTNRAFQCHDAVVGNDLDITGIGRQCLV